MTLKFVLQHIRYLSQTYKVYSPINSHSALKLAVTVRNALLHYTEPNVGIVFRKVFVDDIHFQKG